MFRTKRETRETIQNKNNLASDRKTWIEKEMLIDNAVIGHETNVTKRKKLFHYERLRVYKETDKRVPNKENESKHGSHSSHVYNTHNNNVNVNNDYSKIHSDNVKTNHIERNTDLKNKIQKKLNPDHNKMQNFTKTNIKECYGVLQENPTVIQNVNTAEVVLRPKKHLSSNYSFDNDVAALVHELVIKRFDKVLTEHKRKSYKRQSFKEDIERWTL